MRKLLVICLLLSTPFQATCSELAKLDVRTERIYTIKDGLIVVSVNEEEDRLLRPDLRKPPESFDTPLPEDFQSRFFAHTGVSTYPYFWIYSPKAGKTMRIETNKLALKGNVWGESSGDLENVWLSPGVDETFPDDSIAIFASQMPFAESQIAEMAFANAPPEITHQTFGLQETDYDAVSVKYSKLPAGGEVVVLMTWKFDPDAFCGDSGIRTNKTVYVRTGNAWKEAYSKYGEMYSNGYSDETALQFTPAGLVGKSRQGGEILIMDEFLIVLEKGEEASLIPIWIPNRGVCDC